MGDGWVVDGWVVCRWVVNVVWWKNGGIADLRLFNNIF